MSAFSDMLGTVGNLVMPGAGTVLSGLTKDLSIGSSGGGGGSGAKPPVVFMVNIDNPAFKTWYKSYGSAPPKSVTDRPGANVSASIPAAPARYIQVASNAVPAGSTFTATVINGNWIPYVSPAGDGGGSAGFVPVKIGAADSLVGATVVDPITGKSTVVTNPLSHFLPSFLVPIANSYPIAFDVAFASTLAFAGWKGYKLLKKHV
jgi:hypothetical protein